MKRFVILLMLLFVVSPVQAYDSKLPVPELEKGDILFCEEYPYRTVKNTSRTVYQIARLGFMNVKSFQDVHGLKADGIIGQETQQMVETKYNKHFNVNSQKYIDLKMLGLSVTSELTDNNNISVTVKMRNESEKTLRIAGNITYDSNGGFLFKDPTLSLNKKISIKKNEWIACGSGPWKEVRICAKNTTINPFEQRSVTASLPMLKPNESGLIKIETDYIDATLSTGTVSAMGIIPGSEENNKIRIYFEPGKLDLINKDLDTLFNILDKSKKYRIEGYACKEDKGTDEELMGIAARRAEKIAKILIDHGFPGENITTVTYAVSEDCKAVIIEAGNR